MPECDERREAARQAAAKAITQDHPYIVQAARRVADTAIAAYDAALEGEAEVEQALKGLADWVEYGLDLSDEYSIEGHADEIVGCPRPVRVWVDGQERLDAARAALAKHPEPQWWARASPAHHLDLSRPISAPSAATPLYE